MNSPLAFALPRHALHAVRRAGAAFAACCALAAPVAAGAAPTCLDSTGATVRCETPTALPPGVSPATGSDVARSAGDSALPSPQTLFGLICVLGGLFALIGLMPDFDGWGSGEHDSRHERD